jgi:hypothetical protein
MYSALLTLVIGCRANLYRLRAVIDIYVHAYAQLFSTQHHS